MQGRDEGLGLLDVLTARRGLGSFLPVFGAAALAYVVVIGGGTFGDTEPELRLITGAVAGTAIVAYVVFAPQRADRFDRAVLAALLLFLAACITSAHPRQSLDAALTALALSASLFVARQLLREHRARNLLAVTLMTLSAAITIWTLFRWGPIAIEWWNLNDRSVLPPLDMALPSVPFGHRHDLALLLALLYPSWWLGRPGLARTSVAIGVGVAVASLILLDGSRNLWLAIAVATLVLVGGRFGGALREHAVSTAVACIALVSGTVATGLGGTLVHRLMNADTLSVRAAMWGSSVELWGERPITGWGPGSFPWLLQHTGYFDTQTWGPLHPDSVLFQILPEAGLFGLGAVLVIGVTGISASFRNRSKAARWSLVTFALAGVGANPTDFAFLAVLAISWVAYASPNEDLARSELARSVGRGFLLAASPALVVIAGAVGCTTAASALYRDARIAVAGGEFASARQHLTAAISFDPGLAFYWRQRGELSLATGSYARAIVDLNQAVALNMADDVGWRALGIAYRKVGENAAAEDAVLRAIALQRADPSNLLLHAAWLGEDGDKAASAAALAEIVYAWPSVTGASTWDEFVSRAGVQPSAIYSMAAQLLANHAPAPAGDPVLVSVLARRPDLMDVDAEVAWLRETFRCASEEAIPSGWDRRQPVLWAGYIRAATSLGRPAMDAVRAYELMTGAVVRPTAPPLDPLDENPLWGLSADLLGYRRPPIDWPMVERGLPSPSGGAQRWMLDPRNAAKEASVPCT